jgi:hypothetical protein
MLNVDRVWSRVSQLPGFKGRKLNEFVIQVINLNFTLLTAAISPQTPVNLPAGAIILGVGAAARLDAVAGTQTSSPGLDMFRVAIDYQATARSIVGPGANRGLGSAVFGQYGDLFPAKELVIPVQGSLLYTVENMTTSTIDVTFSHHCLVPGAIG